MFDGRPAVHQAGFELALACHLDHGAAGQPDGPVLRHLGPGVILGEPLLPTSTRSGTSRR
jgi:hypothetical protein